MVEICELECKKLAWSKEGIQYSHIMITNRLTDNLVMSILQSGLRFLINTFYVIFRINFNMQNYNANLARYRGLEGKYYCDAVKTLQAEICCYKY